MEIGAEDDVAAALEDGHVTAEAGFDFDGHEGLPREASWEDESQGTTAGLRSGRPRCCVAPRKERPVDWFPQYHQQ
jgi:hypothetical protein